MPNDVVLVLPKLTQCTAGIVYHLLGQKSDYSQHNLHFLFWTSRIKQKLLYHQLQLIRSLYIKCKKIATLTLPEDVVSCSQDLTLEADLSPCSRAGPLQWKKKYTCLNTLNVKGTLQHHRE